MEKKILLSFGIIFKNEIRCLERCLSSLEPVRKVIPCEVVAADTGSTDGSREVAEKYADILFDFPWINDFSAARNAVMDRCSGEWYFSIDADEWLDENIKVLVSFLKGDLRKHYDVCAISERNYFTYDVNGRYSTFMPWRMLRMATGVRYKGAIHESWGVGSLRPFSLPQVLLHHDGYVEMNRASSAAGRAKIKRNMILLREKLKDNPKDLLAHLQFVESGPTESDYEEKLRRAVELVNQRVPTWANIGPAIYRQAVISAAARNLPELEEWIKKAWELFPKTYFIRLDMAYGIAAHYLKNKDYEKCAHWGEISLRAYKDYRAGQGDIMGQIYGGIQKATALDESAMKIIVAQAYFELDRVEEARALVEDIDSTTLDAQWTGNMLQTLLLLHFKSEKDVSSLIVKTWEDVQRPVPDGEWAEKRKGAFLRLGSLRFKASEVKVEQNDPKFHRYIYTAFLPLKGKCVLGTAAAILESNSVAEMDELLGLVEKWEDLPISALVHAIEAGAQFPPAGRAMAIEKMDALAARLAEDQSGLRRILTQLSEEDFAGSWQSLVWVRGLALAAVQTCNWENESAGVELARTFAKVERAFLAGCYAPEVLQEGNLFVLPPMHRFGWCCAQAFDALEVGDTVGYARFLRAGVSVNSGMKTMVESLIKHTLVRQAPPPSPELMELAEKVRTMLAAYPAGDPAVEMLKASPVYQRVAHLIEGEEV